MAVARARVTTPSLTLTRLRSSKLYFNPSCTSWWARHTRSSPLMRLNSAVTRAPNSQPAPRGETAHASTSSGSDQTRSQKGPSCGISHTRSMVRTWSRVRRSGDRPPWTHRILESMMALMTETRKI